MNSATFDTLIAKKHKQGLVKTVLNRFERLLQISSIFGCRVGTMIIDIVTHPVGGQAFLGRNFDA